MDDCSSIMFYRGSIYVIDKETCNFSKYTDGVLNWSAKIPVNSTQTYKMFPLWNYPDSNYSQNLIALSDGWTLFHFYDKDGKYYGKTKIRTVFEKQK